MVHLWDYLCIPGSSSPKHLTCLQLGDNDWSVLTISKIAIAPCPSSYHAVLWISINVWSTATLLEFDVQL